MAANGDAFDLEPWLLRFSRRGGRYLLHALLGAVLLTGLTYLMPSWYRATAVLLPPEENDDLSAAMPIARLLSRVPTFTGVTRYYTPSDLYKAIIQSRTVQEPVVERFNMAGVYHTRTAEKTLKAFRKHVRASLAPDGTISVAVEDRVPRRAADLTNALVRELDRFNIEKRNFQARRSRMFLDRRVAETDSLLRKAEADLRGYQESRHIVAPPQVESSSLGPVADVLARRMALEVKLQVLRSYMNEDNEEVRQARMELEKLQGQIGGLPQIETELGRLMRDARVYQQVYLLLTSQLEEARFREAMDTPTVTVLDEALPPERKIRPVRWLWGLAGAIAAGLTSLLWDERLAAGSRTREEPPLPAR